MLRKNKKGFTLGYVLGLILLVAVLILLTYLLWRSRSGVVSVFKGVVGCGDSSAIRILQQDFHDEKLMGGYCSQYTHCDDLEVLYKVPFRLFTPDSSDCKRKGFKNCCYATSDKLSVEGAEQIRIREQILKNSDIKTGEFYYLDKDGNPQKLDSDNSKLFNLGLNSKSVYKGNLHILFKPGFNQYGNCYLAINGNNGFIVLSSVDCNYGEKIAFGVFDAYPINFKSGEKEEYAVAFIADKGTNIPSEAKFDSETMQLKKGIEFSVTRPK